MHGLGILGGRKRTIFYWMKKCTRMNMTGVVNRGVPRKMWRSCIRVSN